MLIKDSKTIKDPWEHRTECPPDDGSVVTFKWHWPRGTLESRMSAYELAAFILPHMPHIIPLLGHQPRVQQEFAAMFVQLATNPRQVIDRVVPWIRSVVHTEEDDIIHLSLFDKTEQAGPVHFVMPCQQ